MTNLDSLHIKGLAVNTHIGVHAWEQQILQRLLIDITIPADFGSCEDNIAKTIDYDRLCQLVTNYIESNSFQLIETVAARVADLVKIEFNIQQINVSVSKPHAIKNAANIEVNISR